MSKNSHLPICDAEADAAFAALARFDHVVLAVSGGPDSLALMVLAAEWRARSPNSKPFLSVATVDHGLRPGSGDEADAVGAEARRRGLSHVTLIWDGPKPASGLPMAAREARYRLLEDHACAAGADRIAIVTAHHRDDQAETFAMRLARGAGIDGLAGMQAERPLRDGSPVMLVRPFLAFPKSRLVATLHARGIRYAEDPTNSDHRYERPRVRSLLAALDAAGLTPEAIAVSARRLNNAREALAYAEKQFVATLDLSFGNEVFARFDRQAFEAGPAFLRQKTIARLIDRYGGASPPPQLAEAEDLVARMQRDGGTTATLGGTMISCGPRFVRVWREVGRLDHAEHVLASGETKIWDHRFALRFSADEREADGGARVTVKPLGEKGYGAISSWLQPGRRPPTRAAFALPSFWSGDLLLAAPSLAPFVRLGAPWLDPNGCDLNPLATSTGI
ncbi:MAG: tRNA lysidine(34) synthetase TilS [Hyphomicrobium sp.]|uniref:tRNA lysidine(34) synthetase TilS n=1 Tax=Hyphomicrobium sp. TaxID=82 RepID=UPI0039E529FE